MGSNGTLIREAAPDFRRPALLADWKLEAVMNFANWPAPHPLFPLLLQLFVLLPIPCFSSQGPHLLRRDFNELEAVFSGLLSEFLFCALVVLDLLQCEDGFVIGLSGGEQVVEDGCQLVGCGGDSLGRSEPGPHAAVVLTKPGLASKQRLRGQAQRLGHAVVDPAGVRTEHLAAADPVVWT
jgi:hypothetical protein